MHFKITSIIFSLIVVILVTALSVVLYENNRLYKTNAQLTINIENQNKTIKAQRLELESYVCDIESMKAYALKEYQKAFKQTKDDTTCEGRIKHLENILKSYEE